MIQWRKLIRRQEFDTVEIKCQPICARQKSESKLKFAIRSDLERRTWIGDFGPTAIFIHGNKSPGTIVIHCCAR